MVTAGGLATYGVDYYQLGKQSGMMAADILEGKAKPESMPIQFAKNLKAVFNKRMLLPSASPSLLTFWTALISSNTLPSAKTHKYHNCFGQLCR